MHKLLIICGPTATGKTKLAMVLAQKFNGELVSADSRQIYKGLDVITGKDATGIWMYDVAEVGEDFSVSQYQRKAMSIISHITGRGKLPILVGGTGLYIDAIVKPFETMHIPRNFYLRQMLEKLSVEEQQEQLMEFDKAKWKRLNASDRYNPRRLIRAIEVAVWEKTHGKLRGTGSQKLDVLWIGLTQPMSELVKKIKRRVNDRWENGALKEVQQSPSATALGVNEIKKFFSGTVPEDQAKQQWAREEIRYAKRQMTWFKKNKHIHWFHTSSAHMKNSVAKAVAAWYTDSRHEKN